MTETRSLEKNEDGELNEEDDYLQGLARSMWKSAWTRGHPIVEVLQNFAQARV